ncbi:MAG: imidazole glycerol phosphate synthase subunit HisH [Candidatus Hydrogenedentes bacterium]|nr:imidazole glycerol phosphate synthase subunit HisH [Candidatus Hydrogenedentota bacterium]
MKTVAILDYGMGNLDSVARAVEECGGNPLVTEDPGSIAKAASIILPGVGAFADGMRELRARGLDSVLSEEAVEKKIPLLGICLGMQLLARKGNEGGETEGLGLIGGEVRRLQPDTPEARIPHIGWNEVELECSCPLFSGIPSNTDFYFVHSYHFYPDRDEAVVARTPYCGRFASCIQRENIFGVQFHPEKSQRPGLTLLRNFLAL